MLILIKIQNCRDSAPPLYLLSHHTPFGKVDQPHQLTSFPPKYHDTPITLHNSSLKKSWPPRPATPPATTHLSSLWKLTANTFNLSSIQFSPISLDCPFYSSTLQILLINWIVWNDFLQIMSTLTYCTIFG